MESSRKGNFLGICGMTLAITSTTFLDSFQNQYYIFAIIFAAGGAIGLVLALRVEMIHMPELVAILHSFVGIGATVVGFSSFYRELEKEPIKDIETYIGIFIGALTFSGSVIAYLKLSAKDGSKITKPMICCGSFRHFLNLLIILSIIAFGVLYCLYERAIYIYINAALSILIGAHLILAIGASDIAVVISMLNSYSGWATSASGFLLNNNLLIITGALVGSSGAILSYIMCKAMNRSFINVILGGFGAVVAVKRDPTSNTDANIIKAEAVADLINKSKTIIIVPGYGLAASRSHFNLSNLVKTIKGMGKSLKFCIHPVAGRMPGHMNTLLAEAKIPYNIVYEMREINEEFQKTDLVLVMGANDTVNPDANDPSSSIAGMPVCEVWHAKNVIVMKRALKNTGFAGIENPLFYMEQTSMLLGDMNAGINIMNERLSKGAVQQEVVVIRKRSSGKELDELKFADKISKTIGFVNESEPNEKRIPIIPRIVPKYRAMGFNVLVQPGAGEKSGYSDKEFEDKGATIDKDVWSKADIICKIKAPTLENEVPLLLENKNLELVISYIYPSKNPKLLDAWKGTNINVYALEEIPRNTRGQKLDTLSSMTKIMGYRGVMEALSLIPKYAMDQITSAGKIEGTKVFVIGAGVAGLAAISIAKSIGCRVKCYEARHQAREYVESFGAEVVKPLVDEDAAGRGGYAKELSEESKKSAQELLDTEIPKVDIVVTTAQVPGKEAPKTISAAIVRKMKRGSIIVDLASETGGNCELTKKGELVIDEASGVKIIGYTDWPSRMSQQSSELFSMNIFNLFEEMCTPKEPEKAKKPNEKAKLMSAENFHYDMDNELIREPLIIQRGVSKYISYQDKLRLDSSKKKMAESKEEKKEGKKKEPAKHTEVEIKKDGMGILNSEEIKSSPVNVWSNLTIILACTMAFLSISYGTTNEFFLSFSLFILAIFIGYMVIWNVDRALHTPLMSETNAISGIIVVGAMLQISGPFEFAKIYGMIGVFFASINVVGGFVVTHRVLSMFKK